MSADATGSTPEAGAAPAGGASPPSGPKPSKLPLILVLSNTIFALLTVGFLYYSKMIFKRSPITEQNERTRLKEIHTAPPPPSTPGFVSFDPVTINIETRSPTTPKGTQGRLRYATVGLALEIRDAEQKKEIEKLKPIILDEFLTLAGKKDFEDFTTVQGRYLFRTQILEMANQVVTLGTAKPQGTEGDRLLSRRDSRFDLVINAYFHELTVR